jgi:hypothetical protein
MLVKLSLDTRLVEEAKKLGQFKSWEETVVQALMEYLARHRDDKLVQLSLRSSGRP